MFVHGGTITNIDRSKFINNTGLRILHAENTSVSISHSEFFSNEILSASGLNAIEVMYNMPIDIDFMNNTGFYILRVANANMASVIHSEFINNLVTVRSTSLDGIAVGNPLLYLDGVMTTVSLSKFINNRVGGAIVYIEYYTAAENLTNNVFTSNNAAYEVYIDSECRPGLSLSLGSSRCIPCSENWR